MRSRFDEIRTDRLLMRRWADADRVGFAAMNADPLVMRYFPATMDRAASDAHVDRIEQFFDANGFGLWALEVIDTGGLDVGGSRGVAPRGFIGFTGLNPVPADIPDAGGGFEVGWRLAHHAWHQGYATEAALAALDVGFDGVGLDEIWSFTAVLNEPSQALMRRIGMKQHGFFEHPKIAEGHPIRRHVLYRVTR